MYCLQKRTQAMVEVTEGVSRLKTPRSNPRTPWAQVSCSQKRVWVTAEVLVRMSRVQTDAEALWLWTCAHRSQMRRLALAEVLVDLLSRDGRLESNAGISLTYGEWTEVALGNADIRWRSRMSAGLPGDNPVYGRLW